MAEFTLRPAAEGDAAAIQALVRAVHINPTGLDWRRFIVAVGPVGELLGCGQVKPHGDGSRELASIAVHPGQRGRGIARAVITRLLQEHAPPLYLMCRASVGALYQKFGFRPIDAQEMPVYFRRIYRLAGLAALMAKEGDRLWVMKMEQA